MKKITLVLVICTLSAMFAFALSGCGGSKLDKEVSFNGKFTFSIPQDWQQSEKTPGDSYESPDKNSYVIVSSSSGGALSPQKHYDSRASGFYKNVNYKQTETGESASGIKYQIYSFSADFQIMEGHVESTDIFFFVDSKLYYISVSGDEISAKDIASTLK